MTLQLTNAQLEALYDELLENADQLCRDAEVLLETGSVARGRALVILALEESAKAIAIHESRAEAAMAGLSVPRLDAEFWREWRGHVPKLRRVKRFLIEERYWFGLPPKPHELLLGPLDEYLGTLDRWAQAYQDAKLSAFYVDVDPDSGDVLQTPVPDRAEVLAMIELVEQVGWQVRQGDHIVWRAHEDVLDEMGDSSPFSHTAVTGHQQHERMNGSGWGAYRRALRRLSERLDDPIEDDWKL
jgi:AbiV family abortive infection protein